MPRWFLQALGPAAWALSLVAAQWGCGGEVEAGRERVVWAFRHEVIDRHPPAAYRINDIAVGDLDGDGRADIWTTGRGAGPGAPQMVWYHNPDWTRYPIAPGDFKYGTLADLDGDGDLDVVADSLWFENPGDPRRHPWSPHRLGIARLPDLVHAADLNGDARPELVFVTKHELYVLQSRTDPRSPWRVRLLAREESRRTGGAVADLDGDGDPDILWGNAWWENPGTLDASPWSRHEVDPGWPAEARGAVGDLDGDGRMEVVLSGEEGRAGLAWFDPPKDPRSGPWRRHPIPGDYQGVHSLALADFDGDGDLDLFAGEMHTGPDPDKVVVLENTGSGWREHLLASTGTHNAKVADLDGDGRPDVVGKNFQAGAQPLQVEIWWNACRPLLALDRWVRHTVEGARPWRSLFLQPADMNGDGRLDIVTGGWWYENPGELGGTWTRHEIGSPLENMAVVCDVDGDGDPDVIGTDGRPHGNLFSWAENDGSGRFRIHRGIARGHGDFLQGVALGRLAPGEPRSLVLSWHDASPTEVLRFPERPGDPWRMETLSPVSLGEGLAMADLDGDGDADLHLGTLWLRNDGTRWTPIHVVTPSVSGADPDRVRLGDVDGDGDLDAVVGCEHAPYLFWAEAPNDPALPWREHPISKEMEAMSLDVADLDGDGRLDVVAGEHNRRDPDRGRLIVWRQVSPTEWMPVLVDSGMEHHQGARLFDMDGDGDLDILSMGFTHGRIVLFENLARNP
jgi:hypothetical protein